MKGRFITVEGTEGVGKSTNIEHIKTLIKARGVEVLDTREPGGTPLAEELREILLSKRNEIFDPVAELLIVFAARAQHLNQVIVPALERGCWVVSDRFTDATFAYQGYGRGLNLDHITLLENFVQHGVQPDATFYLDVDVAVGMARARGRAELDRFEEEKLEFFERVRQGYLARIAQTPSRYYVIDAGQCLDDVQQDIATKIAHMFNQDVSD